MTTKHTLEGDFTAYGARGRICCHWVVYVVVVCFVRVFCSVLLFGVFVCFVVCVFFVFCGSFDDHLCCFIFHFC